MENRPLIVIEFADGTKNHYDIAKPLLDNYGWKGTFKIPCCTELSISQLQDLAKNGHEFSFHGWTHAYDAITQRLTKDTSAKTTVLSLDKTEGLGGPKTDIPTKTRISDDANPNGEYIEVITRNSSTNQATLKEGLKNSYKVANNAKLEMDENCIEAHFSRGRVWFKKNGLYPPQTVGMWGSIAQHKTCWWKYAARDYIGIMWGESKWEGNSGYKGVQDSILRYYGQGGLENFNIGGMDIKTIKGIVTSRAQSGCLTVLTYHEIVNSNPGISNGLPEFKETLALIKKLNYQVITFETAINIIKEYSKKDVVLCFYEESIPPTTTSGNLSPTLHEISLPELSDDDKTLFYNVSTRDSCIPIDLTGYSSLCLTVETTYHSQATAGGKLSIYTSSIGEYWGDNWDTEPVEKPRILKFSPGATKRETFMPSLATQNARLLKLTIENLCNKQAMSSVKVIATLGK